MHEAALDRMRWLFDEFPEVVVGFSGGKDSTVVFHLALEVAREKGRLPLTVMFLDQEAEWQATVDQVRYVMDHPDVNPRWYQFPFRLFNATSSSDHWLECWDPAEEHRWMRPQEPNAITKNVYGTNRFAKLFAAIPRVEYPDTSMCYVSGVRTEESPARFVGLTHAATYKGRTWGKVLDRKLGHYTFYPIYDWSYLDVWKAIHANGWPYNAVYDAQYRYGVKLLDMRVSNVHHETAVVHLFYMQEVEPQTYERLTARISGIDTAGKLAEDFFVTELPPMFNGWRQYRDFLLEKLIVIPEWAENWRKTFAEFDSTYTGHLTEEEICRPCISSILTNDHEQIKLDNFRVSPKAYMIRKKLQGREVY